MKIALTIALFSSLIVAPLHASESTLNAQPAAAKVAETETRIELHHVNPSLMAYWLDAENQPLPRNFRADTVPPFTATGETSGFTFPEGIERIEADDATNTLRVTGSENGIESLREIVALLDKPIPQIEISAKLVAVSSVALKSLTLIGNENLTMTVSIPSTSFKARLEELVKSGNARIITEPRVTTFNYSRALMSYLQGPFYTKAFDEKLNFMGYNISNRGHRFTFSPTLGKEGDIVIASQIEIGFIPVRNEKLQPELIAKLPQYAALLSEPESYQTIALTTNLKHGNTILIGGLKSDGENKEEQLLISISAKQIQLADDSIATDATSSTR